MSQGSLAWNTLQPTWLKEALVELDAPPEQRRWLRPVLKEFFAALVRAIETHHFTELENLLRRWIANNPDQTDEPSEAPSFSIFQVVVRLQQATYRALQRAWPGDQAVQAQQALLPVWAHLLPFAAREEMRERIKRVNRRWEEVQREKEQLHQAKLTFISVAAHELRTPLTVIEGYSAILREALERLGNEQLLNYLEGILRGADRIREIVNDLVDISLIHANLLELSFQPLWLNRLFQSLALEFTSVLQERNQTLEVREFPGSDRLLYGDPERLYQAFGHLLSNAIKFTPDGGRITIDGRLLPGFVEVIIQDTGIGIAPEDQEYIFDFFARLGNPLTHSSSKTKFKGGGPGLGLPMTKGIIEAHGGTIWVESPGHDEARCPGSTFHVLLPLYDEPPQTDLAHLEMYRRLAETLRLTEGEPHEHPTR
ncbi:MAG TPA: HAMP domain-containing histidine kinase [Anaerolineae bacterium]|nr:HAMP domain-containing histidine kinase [Anaerolineae bacterium]HID84817.1 HAMP domain-containing histidine kinase [Anaerolineales bacterium]HIQ09713.1 HAMP domain-containing histidine kinase [Anaerolineaceae bacterium]